MSSISSMTSAMDKDFYLNLLIAQLRNQDPSEPMSNSDMVNQMAQLSTVEAMDNLTTTFSEVLKMQQLLGGTELLGRQVEYMSEGSPTSGTVEAVSTSGESVKVVVNQSEISLDDIERIL